MRQLVLGDPDSAGDEIFVGEFTGAINVTKLRKWANKNGKVPAPAGLMLWNVVDLMREHDWDHTAQKRIDWLCKHPKELAKPILVSTWEDSPGVYILDGWHRLRIFYEWAKREKRDHVPFMAITVTQQEAEQFRPPKHAILGDVRR